MPEEKAFVVVQIVVKDQDGYYRYATASHQEIFDKFSKPIRIYDC